MRKNFASCLLIAMAAFAMASIASVANAAVNLEWRVTPQVVSVGNPVSIGLFAVSDAPTETMSAVDAIINWDSTYLSLTGITNNSPYSWQSSGFPNDCGLDGLNPAVCPDPLYSGTPVSDGTVFYRAQRNVGTPAVATSGGLLIATFNFVALLMTPSTMISIPASAGLFTETVVVHGETAGLPITGSLGGAEITIVPEPATLALAALGALSLVRRRRHR